MPDTIFARSTAPGRAGVAVVRLSGPAAHEAVVSLTKRSLPDLRELRVRNILCCDEVIDQAMVVIFPEGESFTGEQSAELHLHGSEAVVRSTLDALSRMGGLRQAAAGEFTQRALENDRLDLAEIEGLGALLEAETDAQRRQAMVVFSGAFGRRVDAWREALLDAIAEVEVSVDFADEEVPQEVGPALAARLRTIASELTEEAEGVAAARAIARGFEVAIVGPPNAGKSTLLNRLAGREAALTSQVAGTTRDVIEVRMDVNGQFVTFLDTAGIREVSEEVEAAGVAWAIRRANAADLRIFLDEVPSGIERRTDDIFAWAKADLGEARPGLAISGLTGIGVSDLLDKVSMALESRVSRAGMALTQRQASGLNGAAHMLHEALKQLADPSINVELVAEDLRGATRALDGVIGRVGVEDVLGRIFSTFCIGK